MTKSLSECYLGHLRSDNERAKRELLYGGYSPEELVYIPPAPKKKKTEDTTEDEEYITPEIPLTPRFEGTWVVGLPGTGKTQLFQHFLMSDLDMVARGEASVVIIDPTGTEDGTLIRNVTRLKRFAPGGVLYGKLIYIDPTDEHYTLPINLLSLRADMTSAKTISSAIGSYISFFPALRGQHFPPYKDPFFR